MTRTVLITGAARRVGAAIARRLAADGWAVIAHYNHSGDEAHALAQDIRAGGGICHVIQADLADRSGIEMLIGRCIAAHGRLDCLINNASRFVYDDIKTVTWESLHAHLDANLVAPVLLSRDFARAYQGRDGCIINLLDQKLEQLNPDFLSYTKGTLGLAGLTRMLALTLAPRIRVCGIAPGIATISPYQTPERFDAAWHNPPLGRSTTPEEIAATAHFLLTTPSITGHSIVLDGGESLVGRQRDASVDPKLLRGTGE